MDDTAAWREQNRRSWNEATRVHNARKGDQAAWLRAGNTPLFPEEVALLGPLAGRRVAHLMCNAGQDTLGLVRLGADAVGVDISDEAIAFARALSEATALPAAFVRSDVYDWLETTDDRVDDAFTSYGGVGWLPDLPRFFRGVARVVRPGGRFVFQDFHPLCWANDADGKIIEPYFIDGPIHDKTGVGDYVGESAGALSPMGAVDGAPWTNPEPSVSFQWTLGDLLNGLANAGFRLEQFQEQPWSNGCRIHPGMVVDADRRWRRPSSVAALPLMVGVVARRDA